jgi:predicted phage terminase large subunit-like protein
MSKKIITPEQNVLFAPVSEPQSQFLTSKSWFTIYGGAAFAGKSMCLLGSMLPILEHPGTRAVIIRKTTKMLSGGSGLFDAAIHLYSKFDSKMKIKSRDLTLVFSSGAELAFTYLDKPADRMNLQGKEFSRVALDECQQLDGENVWYALSRLRSTRVNYQLQAHATANPDPDSFLMKFVEHSLDENLVPIRRESYPERYFARDANGTHFFDSLQDAEKVYGNSKESPIRSYRFVPGCIYDNPLGLAQNEGYVSTLKALPPVEMKRLLLGAWVRESKSGFWRRDWVGFVDQPNMRAKRRCRAWDLAFSEPSEARPKVDATAGVLISKEDANSLYTVENVITLRKRVHEVEQMIFNTAESDGRDVIISLPLDPGATAGAYCKDLARRLSERGFAVKLTRPDKGKLQRFLPFASVSEAGFVNIVKASWTEEFVNELEQTEFSNKTFDDQADATSDAFYHLNKTFSIPSFALPDLTSTPSFGYQSIDLPTNTNVVKIGEFTT